MTNLQSILNAANRTALIEDNFEKLDSVLGGAAAGAIFRIKDGQLQFWDDTAATADPTKPWRALGINDGQLFVSDPIDE